jgi:glycosyltransferase involved in cell wall biosynthesis
MGHHANIFASSIDRNDHKYNYNGIEINQYGSVLGYRSESVSPGILRKPLEYDLDIIHVHSGISLSVIAGYRYAIKKSKPLVITWHGDSLREYGRYGGLVGGSAAFFYKKYIADKVLSRADIIISPSKYYINKSKFINKYVEKIAVIPNGIDLNRFQLSISKEECKRQLKFNGKDVILFMGGLYQLKGPDVLLKAIAHVVKFRKDVLFIFAGTGEYDKYINLSHKLGIEKYVKFIGYVTNDKAIYYNCSDIFVLPSYEEMFPIVLLEASASGLPLVVSDLNSLQCIVEDNYNGIFFKTGNENELANAILYLLDNEKIRRTLGENAKNLVKRYSWRNISNLTIDTYNLLISK